MSVSFRATICIVLSAALLSLPSTRAVALEVLGIKVPGTTSEAEQIIADGRLPYDVQLTVEGENVSDIEAAVESASGLFALRGQGVQDIHALIARIRADTERVRAALYAEARYGATVSYTLNSRPVESVDPDAFVTTPDAPPVVGIVVDPGPVFTFGYVSFSTNRPPADDGASAPLTLQPADYGMTSGLAAKSTIIVDANEKLVEAWRVAGYPLARIVGSDVSADHASSTVNVTVTVDPGQPAVYSWINVVGAQDVSTGTITVQSKLRPGDRFTPKDLATTRSRLAKLESIESVRIIEGEAIDDSGGIPITVEVAERKPRFIGATASLSTIDGAEVQAFWGHRNLFGEAERLRVDGTVSQIGNEGVDQLQFDAGAVFTKPGVLDIDTDLFAEFRVAREHPDTFESLSGVTRFGLNRRISSELSGSVAVQGRYERVEDALGTNRFASIALPGELTYDSRDSRLDATRGVFATALLSPTAALSGGASFLTAEGQAAIYQALDGDNRAIFAARVFAGSAIGASLSDVPATSRYFAGGGGSVRGFEHLSLGTLIAGDVVGGLSLVRASAELRFRVTDNFGIVPFVDAASISARSFPTFSDTPFVGAGIGLRYLTAIGPIRVDFATPITERSGQTAFAFYVGLGQAF